MTLRHLHWVAPFLVGIHTSVFLLARNIHKTVIQEAYEVVVLALVVAGLSLAASYALTRDRAKAVALAAGAVAWFFWFGAFATTARRALGMEVNVSGPADLAADPALIPWTALGALYFAAVLRARSAELLARVWFTMSAVLLALPIIPLVQFAISRPPVPGPLPTVTLHAPDRLPDILYVVFDRYGGPETLRRRYGFDNSDIIAYLRDRGFYVAERSNANYQRTGPSLAATLNHDFIHPLYEGMENVSDWRPFYALIKDHRVGRALRALGYESVNVSSWWHPTRHNPYADFNYSFAPLTMFLHGVYANTAFAGAGISLGGRLDSRRQQWQRVHRKVRALSTIRQRPRPVFVFSHFLLPHDPYVFGPRGEFLPSSVVNHRSIGENYIDQVRFTNVVIRQLVDGFLAESTEARPIIILQADEGPFPPRDDVDLNRYDWRQASRDELREKFGILNALYLPGVTPSGLHPAMTPVNTFRIVFNAYFGTRMELLPDRSFAAVNEFKPYEFFEITSIVSGE